VERKRLFVLHSPERGEVNHGKEMYSPDFSRQTYKRLLELAGEILSAGYSVIVDAAFLKKENRDQFQKLSQDMAVPFAILSARASNEKLKSRILQRQSKLNDASDADLAVLEHLKATQDELLPHELVRTVEFENELDIDHIMGESLNWKKLVKILAT
jgi:predicted kinase